MVEVIVPPLRERRDDIVPLARRFLARLRRRRATAARAVAREAEERCSLSLAGQRARAAQRHRACADPLSAGGSSGPRRSARIGAGRRDQAARSAEISPSTTIEREHILRVLARSSTLEEAARVLGLDASTLWRKRKRYEGS